MVSSRADIMRAVSREKTRPEIAVSNIIVSALGKNKVEFNLKELPGSPDIVVRDLNLCIFVHGCFWHRHNGCKKASMPKSNIEYWDKKFVANVERDQRVKKALEVKGWRVACIWECETRDALALANKITELLVNSSAA